MVELMVVAVTEAMVAAVTVTEAMAAVMEMMVAAVTEAMAAEVMVAAVTEAMAVAKAPSSSKHSAGHAFPTECACTMPATPSHHQTS